MAEKNPIKQIEKALIENRKGLTINQIMEITRLARGTVKAYLDELIGFGRVHEEEYSQNTKVFFLNGEGEFQQSVQMHQDGVLFIDVMTDPWKKPFIRVKFRDKEDKGAIIVNNEESVNKLIEALNKAKPQLKKYRQISERLEETQKATFR